MGAKTLKPATASLYEDDFAVWTNETAQVLRARRFDEIDVGHVADEVEDLGKSERREMLSRLTVLILNLLKWKWQPDKRSPGWQSTIATQRAELRRLFRQSPSLKRAIVSSIEDVYPDAVDAARIETGLPASSFPAQCPFSTDQMLERNCLSE